jgi:hypothetical protein
MQSTELTLTAMNVSVLRTIGAFLFLHVYMSDISVNMHIGQRLLQWHMLYNIFAFVKNTIEPELLILQSNHRNGSMCILKSLGVGSYLFGF